MHISVSDRILIVAPHPDDESVGCGGLLAKYGPQCDILVLTDGRKGYRSTDSVDENKLVQLREAELKSAAALAGVRNVHFLRIPDGSVKLHEEQISAFDITPYSLIFVPNRHERHIDHCVVTAFFIGMKHRQRAGGNIYEYEVWSPLASPTDILDISDVIETKINMVAQYRSQTKYVDYCAMASGLSLYRGAGFEARHAEVYSYVRYRTTLQKLYDLLPGRVRRLLRNTYRGLKILKESNR